MRYNFPREFYLPKSAELTETKHDDANTVVYTYEVAGKPYALVFVGKAAKPLWHHSFRDEGRRAEYIKQTLDGQRSSVKYKAERAAARKNFQHSLKVGSVLMSSWGYDQTNIEFYEVVAVKGKSVTIRELAQERSATGSMSGECVPVVGQYIGEEMTKRVSEGNSVKISTCQRASLHEPKEIVQGVKVFAPSYWTAYA